MELGHYKTFGLCERAFLFIYILQIIVFEDYL
jgi:hypothetical protein